MVGSGVITRGLELAPWKVSGRSHPSSLVHLNEQTQNPDLGMESWLCSSVPSGPDIRVTLTENLNFFGVSSATDRVRGKSWVSMSKVPASSEMLKFQPQFPLCEEHLPVVLTPDA